MWGNDSKDIDLEGFGEVLEHKLMYVGGRALGFRFSSTLNTSCRAMQYRHFNCGCGR
jgi:hypothetical protein